MKFKTMKNWLLSTELMDKVAEISILPIEVYEVVSFTPCTIKTSRKVSCLNFVKHHLVVQRNGRFNGLHL
jgi:hypothetical protein